MSHRPQSEAGAHPLPKGEGRAKRGVRGYNPSAVSSAADANPVAFYPLAPALCPNPIPLDEASAPARPAR